MAEQNYSGKSEDPSKYDSKGIGFVEAGKRFKLNFFDLLDATKGRIKVLEPKQIKQGKDVVLKLEDVIKFKFDSDPVFASKVDDVLKSEQFKKELAPYFALEQVLDSSAIRYVLNKIFDDAYINLSPDQKDVITDVELLKIRSMNIGVIELCRPPYRERSSNVIEYATKYLPREKALQILYRIGVKKIEKAKNPQDARKILSEYLGEF